MKIFCLLCLILVGNVTHAQLIYRADFGPLEVQPLFPESGGVYQLPDEPISDQLNWVLQQLAQPSTSLAEINQRFSDGWLSQISAEDTQAFIDAIRTNHPSGQIIDLVALTPMQANVLIQGQDNQALTGTIFLETEYSGQQKITAFGSVVRGSNLQYPEDLTLSLTQALDKFTTYAADTSVLVAYINDDDQCEVIDGRNVDALRATGSLFKPWVLGGLADQLEAGAVTLDQAVPFVASERVYNPGLVNREPFGTPFKLLDLATLMLGNSDNSATDLVHEVVGRSAIDAFVSDSGVSDPTILSPMLSVNEQFHLFFSFAPAVVIDFLNDSEADQLDFINNSIVPLGPVSSFPFANDQFLTSGSWRASAMDVCAHMAYLRTYDDDSDAGVAINRAYGAQAAQFEVRPKWDRVWYKGGSLVSGATGYHVLTHAWLLEDNGRWPIVVVGMTNDSGGGIDANDGIFRVQSVLARILALAANGL